jgi:hypothetical protein
MTNPQPTERQRRKWREDRARLRLLARHFPAPHKPQLTPDEKREARNAAARERRAALALAKIDLTCPQDFGRRAKRAEKTARKPSKPAHNRAEGPWDLK